MKKAVKRFLVAAVCMPLMIIVLIVASFFISPLINNLTLNSFAKQLYKQPLPPRTQLLEKEAVCGKLNGNGNGMDFFASVLIRSDLSLDELEAYYQNTSVKSAKKTENRAVSPQVLLPEGEKLNTEYVEHADIYFEHLKTINNYSGYYVIMIYDGGYEAWFDLRGH